MNNVKTHTILILLLFIMAAPVLQAQEYKVFRSGREISEIKTKTIRKDEFISFREAIDKCFPESNYSIIFSEATGINFRIKCLPDSYYLLIEKDEDVSVSLMKKRTIKKDKSIYVHAASFLKALSSVFGFKFDDKKGIIELLPAKDKNKGNNQYQNSLKKDPKRGRSTFKSVKPPKIKKNKVPVPAPDPQILPGPPVPGIMPKTGIEPPDPEMPEPPLLEEPAKTPDKKTKKIIYKEIKTSASGRDTIIIEKPVPPENKEIREETKPSPIPDEQHYIVPKNLIRKELDSIKNQQPPEIENDAKIFQNINKSRILLCGGPSPLGKILFTLPFAPGTSLPAVTSLKADIKDSIVIIYLEADKLIDSYQQPEVKDGSLILRIPDAINKVTDFSEIENKGLFGKLEIEFIRNFLLFKLKCKSIPVRMTSKRDGPNKIIYSISFGGKETGSIKDSAVVISNPAKRTNDSTRQKWALDVIVIDPGHGGKDPGAVSIRGYKEKDIALSISLKLKTLIERYMPKTKVVMTRDDDSFVELYRRGQIANENNGKLFISVHLNSMPKKPWPSKGFETYILRPGRNEDAIRVANKENASIKFESDVSRYKKLTEEEIIIATMAQSAFVKLSERFAQTIQEEVGKTTTLNDRGVNQAGFYVLVGASMPNVLFESGFLSNRNDERFLMSDAGQKKIATGLFNAVKRYACEYEKIVNGN